MSLLFDHEGKIFISSGDPEPLQCPECKQLIAGKVADEYKGLRAGFLRCDNCKYKTRIEDFRVKWQHVGDARILIKLM